MAPPPQALLDSDGMLYLNGKRTFVLGLYQLPNRPDPWRDAAGAGFHVVHCKPERAMLDTARQHAMYGWLTTGSISVTKPEPDKEKVRKLVEAFRDHPGVLFWETEDEPTFKDQHPRVLRTPPESIRAAYSLIKLIDPARPVYLNHAPTNLVSTLQRYNPGGDIIATDIYPVIPPGIRRQYALWADGLQGDLLNTSISQVGQYADKMREVAGPRRALWMVLQAFSWEMLRKEGDRDPKMVRYPVTEEIRFMAWQAIVHGVTGLIWWGLSFTPREAPLWDELAAVATELKQLASELAAPRADLRLKLTYHDLGHSLDRGVEWIAKPSGKGILLAAVNADKNPVEATFSGLESFRRASVLGEGRSVRFSQGNLRDEFPPFGVRLYRLEP
ncbi:MAG: hypothetical protein FJW39_14995 [Acidobacteria bacterium]|nr:hypothetical protein [Acidobacteriota bacterium]